MSIYESKLINEIEALRIKSIKNKIQLNFGFF